MFTYQIRTKKPSKRWISNTPTKAGDHLPSCTTVKENQEHLITQRQIGDSQPFSPLELITMYPEKKPVPTKRQQTGDKAENLKEILLARGCFTETITPSV